MVKGEDAVMRKKNKANRKKLHRKDKSSSAVSARVASIIASKKRRMSGKRRMCEGMCFSLPSLEDPFNDRHGKKDFPKKETKNDKFVGQRNGRNTGGGRSNSKLNNQEQKNREVTDLESTLNPAITVIELSENVGCPSKFLILCLNSIENALRLDGTYSGEEGKPLFGNTWGVKFCKYYSVRKNILETSGACSTIEQIAWMVSTAADTIARKEKEGISFSSPYLLYIVPSQNKAAEVRTVCKPLKALGIHTVSLHPGASLDHQIHGLKSCEPEFLVSTPERLLELVSMKAIDISGVSFVVVDGLESLSTSSHLDMIKSIRQYISGDPHTVVFNDCFSNTASMLLQNILLGSVCRLSLNDSVSSQSSSIAQCINVCSSEEEKLLKGVQVLDQAYENQQCGKSKVLYIVGKDDKPHTLAAALNMKGYSISTCIVSKVPDIENSLNSNNKTRHVSVITAEDIGTADIGEYEMVILLNFASSVDSYVQIITRMARHTVYGVLHAFLTKEDAPIAAPLIKILEQCNQAVPEDLRKL